MVVQQSFENFYNDVNGIQGEFVKSWEFVVRRFAADPTVVGYDLLNEPSPGLSVGINDYLRLGAMYDRLIPAIRAAEASVPGGFSHTAYFEPSVASSLLPTPGPATGSAGSSGEPRFTSDPNLVYAPHIYNESLPLAVGSIESGFAAAAKAAEGYGGTPFFSGEWGYFGDDASNPEKVARYAAQEDAYLVGGTWWQWKQACGDPHNVQHRENRPDWCQAGEFGEFESFPADSPIRAILSRAYPRGPRRADRDPRRRAQRRPRGRGRRGPGRGVGGPLVPARCAVPEVSGTNIGAGTVRSVAGGSRVSVPVSGAGEYTDHRRLLTGRAVPPADRRHGTSRVGAQPAHGVDGLTAST